MSGVTSAPITPTPVDDEPDAPTGTIVLTSAPKIRACYWCRFWEDALRPEFYKKRPVVVISWDNRLDGPVMVVPLTTKRQGGNKWAHKLSKNPNPKKPTVESWAVCNHIYTVSCARLEQMSGSAPRMKQDDFDKIVLLVLKAMPKHPVQTSTLPEIAPGVP